MIRVLFALGAIIGLIWFATWISKSSPAQRGRAFKIILLYGIGIILLLLVVTGRIHWLFALLGAALPWLQRALLARQAWRIFKSRQPPAAGNTSKVETIYFRMVLDHDNGNLTGEIIRGDFAGRAIDDLPLDQLLELLQECRSQDSQSAALLEAYLDRHHGSSWRQQDRAQASTAVPPTGPMSKHEAAEILGIKVNSSGSWGHRLLSVPY